jgi:A/G-specific adenine glycosylase
MKALGEEKLPIRKNSATTRKLKEDLEFINDVIAYYQNHGRHELVWRKKISAYKILVSEVMLQQTQVSRVTPKFIEWMKKYPTLTSFAKTNLREVLLLWQGLGYQRRAKALLQIAITTKKLPQTYEALLLLPGIGPYTASAICAFAYDTFSHPVLETNIRTALFEYFYQSEDAIHDGLLYDTLSRLEKNKKVRSLGARNWNYALMDFGAYLKSQKISHNKKSLHHVTQSPYKGSSRELRAKVLFAITHNVALPADERLASVLQELTIEKFIIIKNKKYQLVDF